MPLSLVIDTAPAAEPVLFAEAMAHMRLDDTQEQTLVEALITTARQTVEHLTERSLITTTWRLSLDAWPRGCDPIRPTMAPLIAVTSIKYDDPDGIEQTLAADQYQVDAASEPGRIALAPNCSWPTLQTGKLNAVRITFTAGYGAAGAAVPRPLRQAILLLAAHLYENREEVIIGTIATQVPRAAEFLVAPYRVGTMR